MKIAICGFGTIGSGVYEIANKTRDIEVVKVFNIYDEKKKAILGDLLVTDLDLVINDPEVELVVETMGGFEAPYEVITRALKSHKHVVTANKEVIARRHKELTELAKANGVSLLYEAAVGGGVPVIKAISEISRYDNFTRIYGIMNGTCNYILSKVKHENYTKDDALKEAQILGYAEKDPTADLKGLDMLRKITILTELATNTEIDLDRIYRNGIDELTDEFLAEVDKLGYTVKFIGDAHMINEEIFVSVYPVAVTAIHSIANTLYANNNIYFECENNGVLSFYGMGAGKYPTGSVIINDILDIMNGLDYTHYENVRHVEINKYDLKGDYLAWDGSKVVRLTNVDHDALKKYVCFARLI